MYRTTFIHAKWCRLIRSAELISFIFFCQEQQLYYKEVTEACVGSSEAKRAVSTRKICDNSQRKLRICKDENFLSRSVYGLGHKELTRNQKLEKIEKISLVLALLTPTYNKSVEKNDANSTC